ncbi:MAG: prevent-host-death protein [Streptosporangiaceae bacterium]
MPAVHYDSYTDARAHLKEVLDAAESGQLATVRRDASLAAVIDADRLQHFLATCLAPSAQVVHEGEGIGWSAFVPGLPVAADGATFEEAIDELVDAIREYAQDWRDRLQHAPNHSENWGIVQLVGLSDDDQLRAWLRGPAR